MNTLQPIRFTLCFAFLLLAHSAFAQAPPTGPHVVAATIPPEQQDATTIKRYGLTRDDFAAISKTLPNVELLVPSREVGRDARYSDRVSKVRLIGTSPDYAKLHGTVIVQGRFLTDSDLKTSRSVIVISDKVAQQLFLQEDPVGRNIRIDKNYFVVIGVIDSKQSKRDVKQHVYIPMTTMRGRLGDSDLKRESGSFRVDKFELSKIEMRVDDTKQIVESADIVKKLLERRHEDATFKVTTSLELKERKEER
jgi:putative ABC transport system permease protein